MNWCRKRNRSSAFGPYSWPIWVNTFSDQGWNEPPIWLGFYDGSASVEENYEEQAGLAVSWDLRRFTSITPDGPWVQSGGGSGSVRYIDALDLGDRLHYYYEMARDDGSHELRVNVVRPEPSSSKKGRSLFS